LFIQAKEVKSGVEAYKMIIFRNKISLALMAHTRTREFIGKRLGYLLQINWEIFLFPYSQDGPIKILRYFVMSLIF